jgi:LDH2 family malate/lactate/ureidoglycolate dehydrogenase
MTIAVNATKTGEGQMGHSADLHRQQIAGVLEAWGMPARHADRTAEVMVWADMRGVASHGISMLLNYDVLRAKKKVTFTAEPSLSRDTPVSALVDGNANLGYVPARYAIELAIAKAKASGIGIVSVRNSMHFGACGFYIEAAVDAGLIGMVMTTTSNICVAPTGGVEAKLGTDPIAFGAPGEDGDFFLLDMATTTVAGGKIRNLAVENLPCPPGWILDPRGRPSTEPKDVYGGNGFMTSLGGAKETGSYKGYGLAVMVNILSACLSGASLSADPLHAKVDGKGNDIGHFFLALDPALFRDQQDFRADVSKFLGMLRATKAVDGGEAVMIAGDPERATLAKRKKDGIDVPKGLTAKLKVIAAEAGAEWVLP